MFGSRSRYWHGDAEFVGHTVCCFESMNLFPSFAGQLLPRSRPSQPSYTRLLTSHPALTIVPTSLLVSDGFKLVSFFKLNQAEKYQS